MSMYVYDKIKMESESAAAKLVSYPWKNWPLQRFIVKGWRPKRFDQDNLCLECKTPVKPIESVSVDFGKMEIIPSHCNDCRKKAFEEHIEDERQQVFLRAYGKCGGYQNRRGLFRGKDVEWGDIKQTLSFQQPLIEYAEGVIDGEEE